MEKDHYRKVSRRIYDTLTMPRDGDENLSFFQDPIGIKGKTRLVTNMEMHSQLPQPNYFDVKRIALYPEIKIKPMFSNAILELLIGNWVGVSDVAWQFVRKRPYKLEAGLTIVPNQNFCITLDFQTQIQLNFDYSIRCEMCGDYYQLFQ